MRQPHLIERIVDAVGFTDKQVGSKPTPSTHVLRKDEDGAVRKENWNYRCVIGILNYLAHATRPNTIMSVH